MKNHGSLWYNNAHYTFDVGIFMATLPIGTTELFIDRILSLQGSLDIASYDNASDAIGGYENKITLEEILDCLVNGSDEKLISVLSLRWERIRGSNMCYTQQPFNMVNQLCLDIAIAMSSPISTDDEINALEPGKGPYCLLMPTLEATEDVYGNNIHALKLQEFVLSDNERVFIPIEQCLDEASLSTSGKLRHMVMVNDQCPTLTPDEIKRVSLHSEQANAAHQALTELNYQRFFAQDLGAKLTLLATALRRGGKHSAGEEYNAGAEANQGILAFHEFWQTLSEANKTEIFRKTPTLEDILGRLFRPDDVNYRSVQFCVELIANDLDPISKIYNRTPTLQTLKDNFLAKKEIFHAAVQSAFGLTVIKSENVPDVLQRVFHLNLRDRRELFSDTVYETVLKYALLHKPELLAKFEFEVEIKKRVVTAQNSHNRDTLLIQAAKQGKVDSMKEILNWGGEIESRDINQSTALHWAANNGHVDAVNCLLEQGASLESKGHSDCTALHFAVMHRKKDAAKLLLNKNADVIYRCYSGHNAFDYAVSCCPALIEPILLQMATLPLAQQTEALFSRLISGLNSWPHVLFYAADNRPNLFDALLDKILEQPKREVVRELLEKSDTNGRTALICAATIGADRSFRKLLDLDLNIDSFGHKRERALHLAAYNGHVGVVSCLLERGLSPEVESRFFNGTVLHSAVFNGQRDVVNLLLQKNANVNARGVDGKNALDVAISHHPELIEPILRHLVILNEDTQAECLLNVPGGPYPNVFTYVLLEQPALFDRLFLDDEKFSNEIKATLVSMQFDKHIHSIFEKYMQMKTWSHSHSSYIAAADSAKELLMKCMQAKLELFQSGAAFREQIGIFKKTCESAIEEARPVLSQYREWGKVLAAFLLAVVTFPVSLILCATGLFSIKTKSERLLDQLHESICLGRE